MSKEKNIPALFARVFTTDDGKRVLACLRGMTLDQAMGPETTDAQLRHLEGRRYIVKYIHNKTEQGGQE